MSGRIEAEWLLRLSQILRRALLTSEPVSTFFDNELEEPPIEDTTLARCAVARPENGSSQRSAVEFGKLRMPLLFEAPKQHV